MSIEIGTSKTRTRVGWVLSALAAFPLAMSAVMKFLGGQQVIEGMAHLGIPQRILLPLAVLELTCVVVYLVPRTAVLGAVLLTGYLGGAMSSHVRLGEPPVVQFVLGVLAWAGIYLRDARLGALLPLRK